MKIARMHHRIDLYQPVLTPDTFGGFATEYYKVKSVWAEVRSSEHSAKQAYNTPTEKNTITLRIRPYDAVCKGWSVKWQGNTYEVISVRREYRDSVVLEITEYEAGV